jgi:acyl-ACP thioesterase
VTSPGSDTVTPMSEPAADLLVPVPARGRVFATQRRVRFGDVSPGGRARFDALAAYVQDLAWDDTSDSALPDESAWVVRRSVFEVHSPPTFGELLALQTFCSGLGGRWAERRVTMHGDQGARVESTSLWVRIDAETGRPRPLTDLFLATYAEAATGRRVSAKLQHDTSPPDDLPEHGWPLRFSDFDLLGHVNNAASWCVVEQRLAAVPWLAPPYRAELEYRDPIERTADVVVADHLESDGLRVWVFDAQSSANYLTALVTPLTRQV